MPFPAWGFPSRCSVAWQSSEFYDILWLYIAVTHQRTLFPSTGWLKDSFLASVWKGLRLDKLGEHQRQWGPQLPRLCFLFSETKNSSGNYHDTGLISYLVSLGLRKVLVFGMRIGSRAMSTFRAVIHMPKAVANSTASGNVQTLPDALPHAEVLDTVCYLGEDEERMRIDSVLRQTSLLVRARRSALEGLGS